MHPRPPPLADLQPASAPSLRSALKSSRPSTPMPLTSSASEDPTLPASTSTLSRTPTAVSNGHAHGYTSKVGFDTFENSRDTTLFSYTLQVKSEAYKRTRSTRSYLCAASGDESGSQSLDWVMESLVQDGDELIVLRGFDGEDLERQMHGQLREEARELMKWIQDKNHDVDPVRKMSIIVEFVGGRLTDSIERLIALYRPDSLVVGSRGRTVLQQWSAAFGGPGVGSVSRYCVSRSPVPVIVVRPERKVRKGMEKRRSDPKRGAQFDGLERLHSNLTSPVPAVPKSSPDVSSTE